MKIHHTLRISVFLLFTLGVKAQNWNVFNHNYRYNYNYNYSPVISHVLFADTVIANGSDTAYSLNRIGLECMGSCAGLSTAINPTVPTIVPNMPQFLQRKIKKFQNGLVMLVDTAKLVIKPFCAVNQTWLFDSVNTINAQCINKTSQMVFGVNDSVKLILVGGVDTLRLSKRFGILQFPNLYNKNKYYRLVGIEKSNSYDSTALYGQKVPNAWDFYRFNVGDKFCYKKSVDFSFPPHSFSCTYGNFSIVSKTITATGYSYGVLHNWDTCASSIKNSGQPGSSSQLSYTGLSGKSIENTMYPGQIISTSYKPAQPLISSQFNGYNLVKFENNSSNVFFKYAGRGCSYPSALFPPFMPANSELCYVYYTAGYLQATTSQVVSEGYGVGLGEFVRKSWIQGEQYDYCKTCAVKNNTLIYGTETFVDVPEQHKNQVSVKVYPNPTSNLTKIELGNYGIDEVRLYNSYGNLQLSLKAETNTVSLDLSGQERGLYLLQLLQHGKNLATQKIIKN